MEMSLEGNHDVCKSRDVYSCRQQRPPHLATETTSLATEKPGGLVVWWLGYPSELPWWLSGKEYAYNAGDRDSVPGLERSPGEGNGNPL